MDKYFVILLGICLFSGAYCIPRDLNGTGESVPEPGSVAASTVHPKTVNDVSSNISNATGGNGSTTVTPSAKPETPATSNPTTTIPSTTPNTTVPTSTTVPIPSTTNATTAPSTTQSTTIPTSIPTTTVKPTNATSPTTVPTIPSSTTPLPTPAPSKDRRFDGPSFIGGIVLSLGIMAIAFVAFKFYKARTERNYHTL